MGKKRYTSDGRELQPNEYEFRSSRGNIRYRFDKFINGKRIQKTSDDLDILRKIEAPYRNVFDLFNRADKALKEYEETKGTKKTNDPEVVTYDSPEFGKIRAVMIKGEPWFVGKDIAVALGYKDVKHSILDHVDLEDRINSKTQGQNVPELGQRGGWLINESGFYSLCLSSKLPSAKQFKRWVTSEVLPLIRKHGVYVDDELAQKTDEEKLKAIEEAEKEKEYLRKRNEELEKENSELRYSYDMRGDAYEGFNTVSFSQLTYMYDRSVVSYLEDSGVITKDDRNNIYPTEQYKDYMTTAVSKAGKKFMIWTALGYCDVVYKILFEQYGLKPIRKLNIF